MRRFISGPLLGTRNGYELEVDYVCPLCGSHDVIEPEPNRFVSGHDPGLRHKCDWYCATCGAVAKGLCFIASVRALPSTEMTALVEAALNELVELRAQRQQLDAQISQKEMTLAYLEAPPGEYLARNLSASAAAARDRLGRDNQT